MSALGLNIGVFSNLPVIDRISCLSYLFASTNTYEQNTVSVWDLSQDKWCVKARVWDYLKILHGKSVGSTNPPGNTQQVPLGFLPSTICCSLDLTSAISTAIFA